MGLFGKKKRDLDELENEKMRFFSQSDVEYNIPDSRKPIVVKKEKPAEKKAALTAKRTEKKAADTAGKKAPAKAKTQAKQAAEKKKTAAIKEAAEPLKKKAAKAKQEISPAPAEDRAARSGSFDIKKSKDGRYVFNLYSANRVIIATSQTYSSSQSALTGAKSVMANALKAEIEDTTLKKPSPKAYPKWEIYIDRAGEYRFRLNASNASCVCHAKAGYASKSNCKRAIESIIRLARDAQIDKTYISDKK